MKSRRSYDRRITSIEVLNERRKTIVDPRENKNRDTPFLVFLIMVFSILTGMTIFVGHLFFKGILYSLMN